MKRAKILRKIAIIPIRNGKNIRFIVDFPDF